MSCIAVAIDVLENRKCVPRTNKNHRCWGCHIHTHAETHTHTQSTHTRVHIHTHTSECLGEALSHTVVFMKEIHTETDITSCVCFEVKISVKFNGKYNDMNLGLIVKIYIFMYNIQYPVEYYTFVFCVNLYHKASRIFIWPLRSYWSKF